jgi:hypothetical protein
MKDLKHIKRFNESEENLNVSDTESIDIDDIRRDLSDIRNYISKNNDNLSTHYQETLTRLDRVEQYITDSRLR